MKPQLLAFLTLIALSACAPAVTPPPATSTEAAPVPTIEPSATPQPDTPTTAPSATASPLPTATATATPIPIVTSNRDWTPVIQSFDGVDMVLVPPGCFNMGSDAEGADDDEQPVHQQCFDSPFWLDRTEVTNAAFGSAGMFAGDDYPRDTVPMPDAIAHCEARGARLPTEAEWEYAAKGPSNWTFPWGNDFNGLNVTYVGSSGGQSAPVGSRPDGASWVGAVDLSGNLWEWTSTIYGYDYPYVSDDGREDLSNLNMPRAIRGGSWSNESVWMRASVRKAKHPTVEYYVYVGFRCARDF